MKAEAAILDVDGTLVDSNYEHTRAWYRILRDRDLIIPQARIHRAIGMGSDQLVPYLLGWEKSDSRLEPLSKARGELFQREYLTGIQPLPAATEFVRRLKASGYRVCLASSAKEEEVEHYTRLLGIGDLLDEKTSDADVDATKPEPDLFHTACQKLQVAPEAAIVVGDSFWDGKAAEHAGIPFVGVCTGGFSAAELEAAGAREVYADLPELLAQWTSSPFGG